MHCWLKNVDFSSSVDELKLINFSVMLYVFLFFYYSGQFSLVSVLWFSLAMKAIGKTQTSLSSIFSE